MPSENEIMLALAKQADTDFSVIGTDAWFATWNARPADRSRTDEKYLAWDKSIYQDARTDYWPEFARGIEKRDREIIEAASVRMSAWLTEVYRRAHVFGGAQHINDGAEETSCHIRTLAGSGWFGPEQAVTARWLQPGEQIVEIHFDRIVTDRGRTLNRVELAVLSGQHPRTFTDPAVIEKLEMEAARDAEAAKHAPWESNFYTARNGRRLHLADVEGRRENDE